MKKSIVLLMLLLVASCGESEFGKTRESVEVENFCTPETSKERSEFILQCIKNANPKSDEEPEDWLYQCQNMAEDTLCPAIPVLTVKRCTSTKDLSGACRWYSATILSKTPQK